jgi:hypothetical protein
MRIGRQCIQTDIADKAHKIINTNHFSGQHCRNVE